MFVLALLAALSYSPTPEVSPAFCEQALSVRLIHFHSELNHGVNRWGLGWEKELAWALGQPRDTPFLFDSWRPDTHQEARAIAPWSWENRGASRDLPNGSSSEMIPPRAIVLWQYQLYVVRSAQSRESQGVQVAGYRLEKWFSGDSRVYWAPASDLIWVDSDLEWIARYGSVFAVKAQKLMASASEQTDLRVLKVFQRRALAGRPLNESALASEAKVANATVTKVKGRFPAFAQLLDEAKSVHLTDVDQRILEAARAMAKRGVQPRPLRIQKTTGIDRNTVTRRERQNPFVARLLRAARIDAVWILQELHQRAERSLLFAGLHPSRPLIARFLGVGEGTVQRLRRQRAALSRSA